MNILRSLALDKKLEDGDQECFIALQHFSLWESGGAGIPGVTLPLCLKMKNPGLIQSEHC